MILPPATVALRDETFRWQRGWSGLWRRRGYIVTGVVLAVLLAWGATLLVPPTYIARAALLVEPLAGDAPLSMPSEAEILRSRALVETLIVDMKLLDDPAFNHAATAPADSKFKSANLHQPAAADMPTGVMDRALGGVIDNIRARLTVTVPADSQVLNITYTDRDPVRAALIANRLAALYAEQRLTARLAAQEQVTNWIIARRENLQTAMRAAEERWQQARAAHGLPAALPAIRAVPDEAHQLLLTELRARDAALRAEMASLSARYGARHPKIRALKAALKESTQNLADLRGESVEVTPATATAEGSTIAPDSESPAAAQARLATLEREARTAREMYENFVRSAQDLQTPPPATGTGVRMLSPATIPQKPIAPDVPLILAGAAGGSFVALCLIAFAAGLVRRTFRTALALEGATGRPCYALIPTAPAEAATGKPVDTITMPAAAHTAESVRSLRAMIKLRAADGAEAPRVIAFTSSYPGEGKSTLSAWLARVAAQAGERVIVVDCDMRRPAQHKNFALAGPQKTLGDYLAEKAPLEDIINIADPGGVHVIPAAATPERALQYLSSDRLLRLVAGLRKSYDLVILDAPAGMAATDPLLLARLADLTLYNVTWNDTPRALLHTALRPFLQTARVNLGFVLNKVDLKAHAAYGYGEVGYDYHGTLDTKNETGT